jgi:eukaryotic-like serine/threonine-protein kinase
MSDKLPPQIPDLEVIRLIGRGAYGEVWLVRNKPFGALRAAKLIDKSRTGAVVRELASLRRYLEKLPQQHPNLMPIYHCGETPDHLFYLMPAADSTGASPVSAYEEYEPASLATRLRSGALPTGACIALARQLLDGLHALHSCDLVHRDVKPSNCMFIDGNLILSDFGLVVSGDGTASMVGTPLYMPPDRQMDSRADIYAAGLVVYEMITGLPAEAFPRWPSMLTARLDEPQIAALNRFALKACQRQPELRFRNAGEALEWLNHSATIVNSQSYNRLKPLIALAAAVIISLAMTIYAMRSRIFPSFKNVNFITRPFEAEVVIDGVLQRDADGQPLRTPCTIPHLEERAHRVIFKRSDLPDLDLGNVDIRVLDDVTAAWPSDSSANKTRP